jgi:hypothetical protein
VWTGKMRTLKLEYLPEKILDMTFLAKQDILLHQTWGYLRKREEIEEEIRQRQEGWKSLTAAPPPVSIASR